MISPYFIVLTHIFWQGQQHGANVTLTPNTTYNPAGGVSPTKTSLIGSLLNWKVSVAQVGEISYQVNRGDVMHFLLDLLTFVNRHVNR